MKLKGFARSLIFVRTNHPVPAARPAKGTIVGTGTRVLPTLYDGLRARRRRRRAAMVLCVGLPTLLAVLYYGLIASNRFVSDAWMVLSDQPGSSGGGSVSGLSAAGGGGSSILSMVGLGGSSGSSSSNEQGIVTNYLGSMEAMEALDKKIGLRKMWSAGSIDLLSRLSKNASKEDFYKYYGHHVTVISDPTDPVIQIEVDAFTAADAHLIAKTLVQLSQDKLNDAFLQMREDALTFARSEVKHAQQDLTQVNDKLRSFRNEHGEIDPTATAAAVGTVAGGLYQQLADTEANLRATLSYAREDSAIVKTLQSRVVALKKQIVASRNLLASSAGNKTAGALADKPYAELLAAYQDLLLDQTFAQDAYTSAMAFLNTSRAALQHQHSYLIDFLAPTRAQDATLPHSTRNVVLVLIAGFIVWLTGSLILAALREHSHH
jgi:capsular polysaccharide transport system permease protein